MSYSLTGNFTVKAARNRGTKPNPHGGELVQWYVDFLDADGQPVKDQSGKVADAFWQRKPGSDVTPGDAVYGIIEEGQYGLRFKKLQTPDAAPSDGSRSHGSKSKEWKPESQYDPEKTARIGRAHAQGMAVRVLTAMGTFESKSADQLIGKLKEWTDFFEADVNAAAQKAAQGAGNVGADSASSPTSPREASPAPAQDVHQRIEDLLEKAGVHSAGAHALAGFAITDFSPQEQDALVERLQGPNTKVAAVDRIKERYGKQLPAEPSGDDDIPF